MKIIKVDNPFVRGGEAFANDVPREACPYPQSSPDRQEWLDGWDEARQHEAASTDKPPQ